MNSLTTDIHQAALDRVKLTRFEDGSGDTFVRVWVDDEIVHATRIPYDRFRSERHRLLWLQRKLNLGISRAVKLELDERGYTND